jgi:hypothetical protein
VSTTESRNYTFSPAVVSAAPPCSVASFEVNSEPHTGARPSVPLCVGLITALSQLWQISPRSDGADRPAPAAKDLGVGLLITALAHLHVRNLARRFGGFDSTLFFRWLLLFLVVPEGRAAPPPVTTSQNP